MVFSCFKSTAAKKRVATSAVKAMGLPFTVTRNVSTSALPVPLPFVTNKEQHLSGTFSNLKVTVAAPSGEQGDFLSQTKNLLRKTMGERSMGASNGLRENSWCCKKRLFCHAVRSRTAATR